MFIILASCSTENKQKKEAAVIPKGKMIPLLVDIHLADAAISVNRRKQPSGKEPVKQIYVSVLNKHGFTREQFDKSIDFYSQNIEEYVKIYDEVIIELSKLEGANLKELGDAGKSSEPYITGDSAVNYNKAGKTGNRVITYGKPDSAIFESLKKAKERVRQMVEQSREKNKKKN